MSTPWVPPTMMGVRNSPMMGMNTKMQAVMMPGRICGSRMCRSAWSGLAPEVLRRLQLSEVEAFEGGIEGQRREREVDVDQHDEDADVVVDEQARSAHR